MIKSGSTAWQIIKPGVDLGLIDSIIITYKTLPGYGSRVLLQKRYPDDTRVNGDELLLPLAQADTTLLREEGGDRVRLELQYNYSSGAVAKSEIQTVHIGDTLATAFVDGSNPDEAQIEGLPIEFAAGDAIVIESKNKCVKDWNENDPTSPKYIEGRTHYRECVFHRSEPLEKDKDAWHQIDRPTDGVHLLIDGTEVPDYWWPRYTERENVIAKSNAVFHAEIRIEFPDGTQFAGRSTSYSLSSLQVEKDSYTTMIDEKNYFVKFISAATSYTIGIYIIVDTSVLPEEYASQFPVRGIYFFCDNTDTLPNSSYLAYARVGIFKYITLEEDYLPSTIARKNYVDEAVANAGGSLIVTIAPNDDGTLTTSRTSQEIYEAYMGGKSVMMYLEGDIIPLGAVFDPSYVEFVKIISTGVEVIRLAFAIKDDRVEPAVGEAIPPMTPATADEDGASGLVPAPAAGQQDMVLHGDGTWREVNSSGVIIREW